jgi:hypothetical protein
VDSFATAIHLTCVTCRMLMHMALHEGYAEPGTRCVYSSAFGMHACVEATHTCCHWNATGDIARKHEQPADEPRCCKERRTLV